MAPDGDKTRLTERRTVSIIVPVYNKKPYLRRCLDSIANQTDKSAQVILIDDGSTDGSTAICAQYREKYGWDLWCTQNRGVSAARNLGLERATGDFVTFMDADDTFEPEAVDVMTRIARHDFNIYQFGHYRYMNGANVAPVKRCAPKRFYGLDYTPSYTSMVWNKLYKKAFLDEHGIRFDEDLKFGEDELFNSECILANRGLYHAPQVLSSHYFDDMNSICRGGMCKDFIVGLDRELRKLRDRQTDPDCRRWVQVALDRHYATDIFIKYGVKEEKGGKYDVVYFVKNMPHNEELRYSLRSVEENLKYRKLWIYGGLPLGIRPDARVKISQTQPTKWERVRNMLYEACQNDGITEDFWLFNDDFFILTPMAENMPAQYDGTLTSKIDEIEASHNGEQTEWTSNLRRLRERLREAGKPELNYAVHKPMLINRKKMLEVLDKYPDEPMSRALYGNYWELGGVNSEDTKLTLMRNRELAQNLKKWQFVSTSDESFAGGDIGRWLRDRFPYKSRFEVN